MRRAFSSALLCVCILALAQIRASATLATARTESACGEVGLREVASLGIRDRPLRFRITKSDGAPQEFITYHDFATVVGFAGSHCGVSKMQFTPLVHPFQMRFVNVSPWLSNVDVMTVGVGYSVSARSSEEKEAHIHLTGDSPIITIFTLNASRHFMVDSEPNTEPDGFGIARYGATPFFFHVEWPEAGGGYPLWPDCPRCRAN